MTHVLTLITHDVRLTSDHLDRVAALLPECGVPLWLAPETAADLPFAPPPGRSNPHCMAAARTALDGAPVDVVVQSSAHRRKRLLVADMDSTLIDQECIDELADVLGCRDKVAAITERSMRGELPFEASLRERVSLLAGLDLAAAMRIATERVTVKAGAATLVHTMRAHGALTIIASGGFTLFTAHVAALIGVDRHYANTLVIEDGRLTGTLREPIFGRSSKRDTLCALREERGLAPEETLAVGDGANDLAMLEEAGVGVAFHAKPAVAAAADVRIEHSDLTALLYLQGFSRAEFAE